MLVPGQISEHLKSFILQVNELPVENRDLAVEKFTQEIELIVFNAIRSLTIVIPSSAVIVTGANAGGPVLATNLSPIILQGVVK